MSHGASFSLKRPGWTVCLRSSTSALILNLYDINRYQLKGSCLSVPAHHHMEVSSHELATTTIIIIIIKSSSSSSSSSNHHHQIISNIPQFHQRNSNIVKYCVNSFKHFVSLVGLLGTYLEQQQEAKLSHQGRNDASGLRIFQLKSQGKLRKNSSNSNMTLRMHSSKLSK